MDLLSNGESSPGMIPENRDRLVRGVLEEDYRRIDLERDIRIERDRGRQQNRNSSSHRDQVETHDFEQGHAFGATSTVRRVAFVNGSTAVSQNTTDREAQ
uniref:Uncharacterized protein n=1 Tax=Trichogramma kaykai TaxID=54128 RepID=A0ABD2W9T8_9HYME